MDKGPKDSAGFMPEEEFDDLFPDFTVMWDEIKNEWNRELFGLDPEDDEYRDEDIEDETSEMLD
jgi:hypothetical protein